MKGNTFPPVILSQLSNILEPTDKGAYRSSHVFAKYLLYLCNLNFVFLQFPNVRITTEILPGLFFVSVPGPTPVPTIDPRTNAQSTFNPPTASPLTPPLDPQAALLALLTQAAAKPVNSSTS